MARAARRLILKLAAILAALLLLVLAGIAALVLFVDADRFRPRIERAAGQALGRPVSLGRLHWDLGRRIAIRTEGGAVANLPGFDSPQLASWRSIGFGLALRPLLRRDVRVDHLQVDGLVLDLQRTADGRANWIFADPAAGPSAAAATEEESARGMHFELDSLALQDASVRFRDEAAARDIAASAINLSMKLPPQLTAPQLQFTDVVLDAKLRDWPLRLRAPKLGVATDGPVIDLPAFDGGFDGIEASGGVQASLGGSPAVDARLQASTPSLRRQLERLGRPLSPMQDGGVPGPVDLQAHLHLDDGALRIENLVLRVDDTTLTGRIEVPTFDPLALRFDLQADSLQVDRYLTASSEPSDPYQLPVAGLRSADVQGTLRIGQLEAAGATARESVITVE